MTAKGSLPEGWRWVRFGDVVRQAKETTRDPQGDALTRIVGLGHLDSESLPLRRWDELDELPDGTSFTRVFRAGQVLFGKRRAYQRKVALADFDGVCSGDILVFEPSTPELLSEFLPYLVQSEGFFARALGTSAGSLSPRTRWRDLAAWEFVLPDVAHQRAAMEVLGWSDLVREEAERAAEAAQVLAGAVAEHAIWSSSRFELQPLADALRGARIFDGDWVESKDQSPHGIRLIQLADIGEGLFLDKSERFVSQETFDRLGCTEVRTGDLLVSRMADPIGRTCRAPEGERMITAVDVCVIRLPENQCPDFWMGVLNSERWRRACESAAGGSTRTRVSRRNLEAIEVPLVAPAEQELIGRQLAAARGVAESSIAHAERTIHLRQAMLEQLLAGEAASV